MSGIFNVNELTRAIVLGDRVALARGITLVESTKAEHLELGSALISASLPHAGKSRRIGISGVPGVGKSTFIESFGLRLTQAGHRVAVLAVDPSSGVSGGSILGDRTRMERLSADPNAFIRPTPSGGSLGGVARRTRETITLCEAAGFDTVLVETVGVGQSETAVHGMVDMFLLLVLATAGDELQGIKRGIMEMTDAVIINKDDGKNSDHTAIAMASYHHALHLFPAKESGWTVPVLACSAFENRGLEAVVDMVERFFRQVEMSGHLQRNRAEQNRSWLKHAIEDELRQRFLSDPGVTIKMLRLEEDVRNGSLSPFAAARQLIDAWIQRS